MDWKLSSKYICIIKFFSLVSGILIIPTYMLAVNNPDYLPLWLIFIKPTVRGSIPLFLQFLILEFLLDILRFPWINRKDSLSSFFSAAIIIMVFTFTAKTGWFATEAVFLEVLALISGLSYSDFKLFLTAKFERIFLLFAVQAFGWLGMIIATACIVILNIANKFHKKFINLSYARNNNDLK